MTSADDYKAKISAGNLVEIAFKRLAAHVGDCEVCAFMGDRCEERDALLSRLVLRNRAIRKYNANPV